MSQSLFWYVFQPERIDPSASRQGYDVRSDVWSLGITLVRQIMASSLTWNLTFLLCLRKSWVQSASGCFVFAFSMSWPREGFLTPSGIVFLISWHKWWKVNHPSSATQRTGSSPPSSSILLTYGEHQDVRSYIQSVKHFGLLISVKNTPFNSISCITENTSKQLSVKVHFLGFGNKNLTT